MTEMAKFTAAQFKKVGIKHIAEEDFKDDGTSFKIYECPNDIKFRYATCDGDVFIAARDYFDRTLLTDNEIVNAGIWSLSDKFNGVPASSVNVNDIIKTFEQLKSKVEALEASAKNDNIVEEKKDFVASKLEYEIEFVKSKRDELKSSIDFLSLTTDQFDTIKRCFQYVDKYYIETVERKLDKVNKGSISRSEMKSIINHINATGFLNLNENGSCFWLDRIKDELIRNKLIRNN